jgi:LysR family glycine cleavage system transcriptional activator
MSFNRIPPIKCLVTFEALARLRSATKAADELFVTPSAVTHRIRQLETQLGFQLFEKNDFSLTDAGAAYLRHVHSGLHELEKMTGGHVASATRLRVAVTPTFCRQILMPNLALFRIAYPEIELVLQVSIPLLDVKAEPSDIEIRFGSGDYKDVDSRLILTDEIFPACSPSYLDEAGPFEGFRTEEEVAGAHLIRSPLEPWSPWFRHVGLLRKEPASGSQFNDIGLIYDAAASGFGVALVRKKLGAQWLESGRLVRLSGDAIPCTHNHHLCWSPSALNRWECAAFADWLTALLRQR